GRHTSFSRDWSSDVCSSDLDLFGGDEINRNQVRRFIGMLRALAIAFDTAVVLLSHPSVQGMQTGTGTSGSTAWNNSVRSRLYLRSEARRVGEACRCSSMQVQ